MNSKRMSPTPTTGSMNLRATVSRLVAVCLVAACFAACFAAGSCSKDVTTKHKPVDAARILAYTEVRTISAPGRPSDVAVPLVVAIHGLGDKPESFAGFYRGLAVPARVVLPAGPTAWGDGYSWFSPGPRDSHRAKGGGSIRDAVEKLARFIQALRANEPASGKTIVTGFSQGGILSFSLAVLHPELVGAALPISGTLTEDLRAYATTHAARLPEIIAFHGEADPVIPVATTTLAVDALRRAGATVELHTYSGIGHHISPQMRNDYFTALRAAVEAAAGRNRQKHRPVRNRAGVGQASGL